MAELRTFRLGTATSVIAVRGELDDEAAEQSGAEIARRLREGVVVVDLLDVSLADDSAVDRLLRVVRDDNVTVVAEHRLLDRLDVEGGVRVIPTLAAALPG
jgi:hypothetical protein